VERDIPTHVLRGTEKIDKSRSISSGSWATRVAAISEELVNQANIPKEEGTIVHWIGDKGGFVKSDAGTEYYFNAGFLIEGHRSTVPVMGQRVRFYPAKVEDSPYAFMVEFI
jgi:hypothetical protein